MKQSIEVLVSARGDISINAIGFKGADCEKATKALEEALGVVRQKTRKPEYHQSLSKMNQQWAGN